MRAAVLSVILLFTAPGILESRGVLAPVRAEGPDLRTVFVSPDGNDSNTGTHEHPKQSLEAARDLLRGADAKDRIIQVKGDVFRTQSLHLDERDSGLKIIASDRGRIVMGRPISQLTPVTDPKILARLPESARAHIRQANLRDLGITDFGKLQPRGFGLSAPGAMELFADDKPMTLARWPNTGEWQRIDASNGVTTDHFTFTPDRPRHWKSSDNIWMHGYWGYDWADSYERIASFDFAHHLIQTAPPRGPYGYRAGQRFYFLNILEELDSQGEYYIDRNDGILYIYPPDISKNFWVSSGEGPIVSIQKASNIRLENLTLEGSWTSAINISDSTNVVVSHCTIRNTGTLGVVITGGSNCGLSHCQIYNTGEGAVTLTGGDRAKLIPCNHFVEDSDLHDYARTCRTYNPGVYMTGVGCRVSHCAIHNAPHQGILLSGNEHVIEFSHLHDLLTETGDAGAIYIGRDWTQRGTVIRNNLFEHIQGPGGTFAIYFDDGASAGTIQNNIFYRCTIGVFLGGSTDMLVENNMFLHCDAALHIDGRADMLNDPTWRDNYNTLVQRLRATDYAHPPYSTKYPQLLKVAKLVDAGKGVPPERDIFRHNIQLGGTWQSSQYGIKEPSILKFENNFLNVAETNFKSPENLRRDVAPFDYQLREDSPLLNQGFQIIASEQIGPRR